MMHCTHTVHFNILSSPSSTNISVSVKGEIVLKDEPYDNKLTDRASEEFKKLSKKLTQEVFLLVLLINQIYIYIFNVGH